MEVKESVNTEDKKPKLTKQGLRKTLFLYRYIKPYKYHFIGGLAILFFSRLVFMVFPYLAGLLIDIAQGESEIQVSLSLVGLVFLGVLVVQAVLSYLRVMLFAVVSEKGLAQLREDVFTKLLSLKLYFFEDNRTGDLISRVTGDIEKLYNILSVVLAEFIGQVVVLIAGIVFLFIATPNLALTMFLTFPFIVVGAIFFGKYIRRLSKERQAVLAESNNIISESIQAIDIVKAFTNEMYEKGRYKDSLSKMVTVSLRYARSRGLFTVFIITLLFGALFFIIFKAALMVQEGSLTAGQLISFVSYTALIGGSIASLSSFYTQILGAIGATERVREVLEEEEELSLGELNSPKPSPIKSYGKITFDNVSFRYPSRQDVIVLKDVSFTVEPGQKVALVGHSGAGKSTIMRLLLRYYAEYSGEIKLDDKSIDTFPVQAYRSILAVVPQEVLLFAGTIRENILYGKPDASDTEVLQACEQANALEFIQTFPEGLDTIVGERGVKLSGGQKQRIAIARAILHDPIILLLDEATSSLDTESESEVKLALDKLMENRTSIIIAHRLSTIKDVDRIYVLDQGEIVESGTHEELSEIPDGRYNSLARLQFQEIEGG